MKKLELGHPPPPILPISIGGGVTANGESAAFEATGSGDGAVGMLPSGEELSCRRAGGR